MPHKPLRRAHSHAAVIQGKHVSPPSLPAESPWIHSKSPAQHKYSSHIIPLILRYASDGYWLCITHREMDNGRKINDFGTRLLMLHVNINMKSQYYQWVRIKFIHSFICLFVCSFIHSLHPFSSLFLFCQYLRMRLLNWCANLISKQSVQKTVLITSTSFFLKCLKECLALKSFVFLFRGKLGQGSVIV